MPSSSSTRSTVLRNCLTRMISPKVESCCGCCSLKVGVLFTALLFLVNASLAFAGEAALYLGKCVNFESFLFLVYNKVSSPPEKKLKSDV